ncbi:CKLF-like MARVEL transmembrane domain-containing protein 3 isoform X1 [Latimeria chalumnae]|uniref:CKLF-like MARVEL transmembrane domain-containing protein 3 isoform X1 n=1 Tax=Latimeria chalumnae TaxID=7897 RepID=UPI00313D1ACA
MEDLDSPSPAAAQTGLGALLPTKAFLTSRKGILLSAEVDFLRCVSAAIIYFVISIIAISQRSDGAAKAAGVFGFIATIVFALDFYIIFNDLANFLRQGNSANTPEASKSRDEDSDSDED